MAYSPDNPFAPAEDAGGAGDEGQGERVYSADNPFAPRAARRRRPGGPPTPVDGAVAPEPLLRPLPPDQAPRTPSGTLPAVRVSAAAGIPAVRPDVTATRADVTGPGLSTRLALEAKHAGISEQDVATGLSVGGEFVRQMATDPVNLGLLAASVTPGLQPVAAAGLAYLGAREATKPGRYLGGKLAEAMGGQPSDVTGAEALQGAIMAPLMASGAAHAATTFGDRMAANAAEKASSDLRFSAALDRAKSDALDTRWMRAQAAQQRAGVQALPAGQYDMPAASFMSRDVPETDPARLLPAPRTAVPTEQGLAGPAIPTPAIGEADRMALEAKMAAVRPRSIMDPSFRRPAPADVATSADVAAYQQMRDAGVAVPGPELGGAGIAPRPFLNEPSTRWSDRMMRRQDLQAGFAERLGQVAAEDVRGARGANGALRGNLTTLPQEALEAEHARLSEAQSNDLGKLSAFDEHPDTEAAKNLRTEGLKEDAQGLVGGEQAKDFGMLRGQVKQRQLALDKLQAEMDRRAALPSTSEGPDTSFDFGANRAGAVGDRTGAIGTNARMVAGQLAIAGAPLPGAMLGAALAPKGKEKEGAAVGAVAALGLAGLGARAIAPKEPVPAEVPDVTFPESLEGKSLLVRQPSAMGEGPGVARAKEYMATRGRVGAVGDAETTRLQQAANAEGIDVRAAGRNSPHTLPSDPEVNLGLLTDANLDEMNRAWVRDYLNPNHPPEYKALLEGDRSALDAEIARRAPAPITRGARRRTGAVGDVGATGDRPAVEEAGVSGPSRNVSEAKARASYEAYGGQWSALSDADRAALTDRMHAVAPPDRDSEFPDRLYSRTARAINDAPFARGTAEQWTAALKKNVPASEREHVGLDDFLEQNKGKVLTRAQVAEHFNQNRIRLSETTLGEQPIERAQLKTARDELDRLDTERGFFGWEQTPASPRASTEGWRVIEHESNPFTGQRSVSIVDPEGGVRSQRSGTRLSDADLLHQHMTGREEGADKFTLQDAWEEAQTKARARGALPTGADLEKAFGRPLTAPESEWLSRYQEKNRQIDALEEKIRSLGLRSPARYSGYVEPGGTNYREHLLQLDKRGGEPLEWETSEDAHGDVLRPKGLEGYEIRPKPGRDDGPFRYILRRPGGTSAHESVEEAMGEAARVAGRASGESYRSSHWPGVDNPLVHVRLSDRTLPSGEKATFIEEIQSDWHQKGRRAGYQAKVPESRVARFTVDPEPFGGNWQVRDQDGTIIAGPPVHLNPTAADALEVVRRGARNGTLNNFGAVPDAPFKKTPEWAELGLKKAIDEAVRNGSDRVVWTTGTQQADRYDLSKAVDAIRYDPRTQHLQALKNDRVVHEGNYDPRALPDVIGKEAADKLLASETKQPASEEVQYAKELWEGLKRDQEEAAERMRADPNVGNRGELMRAEERTRAAERRYDELTAGYPHEISGVDLKVGGEGMKGFYDRMLLNVVKDYAKKMGVKLEVEHVPLREDGAPKHLTPTDVRLFAESWERANGRGPNEQAETRLLHSVADMMERDGLREDQESSWRDVIAGARDAEVATPQVIDRVQRLLEGEETRGATFEKAYRSGVAQTENNGGFVEARHIQQGVDVAQDFLDDATGAAETAHGRKTLLAMERLQKKIDALGDSSPNGVWRAVQQLTPGDRNRVIDHMELEETVAPPKEPTLNPSFRITPELAAKVKAGGQPLGYMDPKLAATLGVSAAGAIGGAVLGAASTDDIDQKKLRAQVGAGLGMIFGGMLGAAAIGGKREAPSWAGQPLKDAPGISSSSRAPRVAEFTDALKRVFNPGLLGPGAEDTAGAIRAQKAFGFRRLAQAKIALGALEQRVEGLSKPDQVKLWDLAERWTKPGTRAAAAKMDPALPPAIDAFHAMSKTMTADLQRLGILEPTIEDYVGRFWIKDPDQPLPAQRLAGKRPLEGPKSFTKQRTYETFTEGLEAGETPATYNFVTAQLAKFGEMQRAIDGRTLVDGEVKAGRMQRVMMGHAVPETPTGQKWTRIGDGQDPAFTQYLPTEYGRRVGGYYYAPPDVAAVWNNFLGKGWRGSPLYRALAAPGQAMAQVLLGISGFHGTVIGTEAAFSELALGAEAAVNAHEGAAATLIKSAPRAVGAPVTGALFGRRIMQEYLKPGTHPELAQTVDAMMQGGWRGQEHSEFMTGDRVQALQKALRDAVEGESAMKRAGGAARAVPDAIYAAIEKAAVPILGKYVPWQKAAATYFKVAQELQQLPPDASPEVVRARMGDVVKEMDYRFGQVIYENHFINNVAKDAAQLLFLAPGWTFGTATLMARGAADVARLGLSALKGQPALGKSGAYWAASLMGTAVMNGILTYAMTGETPTLKDLLAFRDGTKDADGNENRHTIPGYLMHDVYGWTHHPVRLLGNKLSPPLHWTYAVLANENHWGDEVYNPDDSPAQIAAQIAKYSTEFVAPLSVQNALEASRRGEGTALSATTGVLGVGPAPKEYVRTDAQNTMADIIKRQRPSRTPEEQADADLRFTIQKTVREQGIEAATDVIQQALQEGRLTPAQVRRLLTPAKEPPLARKFKGLTLPAAEKVFERAKPGEPTGEREMWAPYLFDKRRRAGVADPGAGILPER